MVLRYICGFAVVATMVSDRICRCVAFLLFFSWPFQYLSTAVQVVKSKHGVCEWGYPELFFVAFFVPLIRNLTVIICSLMNCVRQNKHVFDCCLVNCSVHPCVRVRYFRVNREVARLMESSTACSCRAVPCFLFFSYACAFVFLGKRFDDPSIAFLPSARFY